MCDTPSIKTVVMVIICPGWWWRGVVHTSVNWLCRTSIVSSMLMVRGTACLWAAVVSRGLVMIWRQSVRENHGDGEDSGTIREISESADKYLFSLLVKLCCHCAPFSFFLVSLRDGGMLFLWTHGIHVYLVGVDFWGKSVQGDHLEVMCTLQSPFFFLIISSKSSLFGIVCLQAAARTCKSFSRTWQFEYFTGLNAKSRGHMMLKKFALFRPFIRSVDSFSPFFPLGFFVRVFNSCLTLLISTLWSRCIAKTPHSLRSLHVERLQGFITLWPV